MRAGSTRRWFDATIRLSESIAIDAPQSMDLSELNPAHRGDVTPGMVGETGAPGDHSWSMVALVGAEIATALTAALERATELERTGSIDRQGLRALIDDVQHARRTGFVAQQLARLTCGGVQQQHEVVALAGLVSDVLAQREAELGARGIALRRSVKQTEVVVDASLLASFVHATLDWAARHARTSVEIRIDAVGWPQVARFACRFGHVPDDQADLTIASTASTPPGELMHVDALDCLWWRLTQQLAATMRLPLTRRDTAASTSLTIEFPHTANEALEGASAFEIDTGFAVPGESRPLMGSHVLVIAAQREVRNQVRQAVAHMGLMLDFVSSIEAALEFCQQGFPQAIVYEASLGERMFTCLRQEIALAGRALAWIEITDHGETFEVSSAGHAAMARVGRDGIAASLPSALMFELARAA